MKDAGIRTAAKINWDLRVLGRRPDGYHELRSWFVAIGWWDELRVSAGATGSGSRLTITGPASADVPTDATNLVLRAEAAWRAAFPARARVLPPLHWRLTKNIPHGAGLGGGSGNAAGALELLERWAPPHVPASALAEIAASLGSDLNFFLEHRGAAELRGGRGELRLARAPAPAPFCVVALPHFRLGTAAVYAALQAPPAEPAPAPQLAGAPQPRVEPGPNDLAAAAARVEPELITFSDRLREHAPFLMTGSGSAFFAPCPDAAAAALLAEKVAPLCLLARDLPILSAPALQALPEKQP
jgi:4-diphosphocytidyl-2-C-methyl-D-erythritol kinase